MLLPVSVGKCQMTKRGREREITLQVLHLSSGQTSCLMAPCRKGKNSFWLLLEENISALPKKTNREQLPYKRNEYSLNLSLNIHVVLIVFKRGSESVRLREEIKPAYC